MKKVLFAVIALVVIGAASCKKDAGAQPEKANAEKVLDKKDASTWD